MKGTAYLIQGMLVLLWWTGLTINDDFYDAFQFPGVSRVGFDAFFGPDLFIISFLSLTRAYKQIKELELIIFGAFAYASLYCLNITILSSGGYLPTSIMMLGLFYNFFLIFQTKLFNESRSKSIAANGLKTVLQIFSAWSITLVFFPWIIIDAFEIHVVSSTSVKILACSIFLLSSSLGLFSAYVIVKHGEGTPLPTAQTKKLVIHGPYTYIRNPMAVAGMGQGLAISIYFGSIHMLIYTLIGGLLWQLVVRPSEEENMAKRFGKEYLAYKRTVNLWIPKRKKASIKKT